MAAAHGAFPHRGGTIARLGSPLGELDRTRLPMRVTAAAEAMIATMAGAADHSLRTTLLAFRARVRRRRTRRADAPTRQDDGRYFSRLGIQTYGPAGTDAITCVLRRFGSVR